MIERGLERLIFASRWLLVPFYLGLTIALALLAFKFLQKLVGLFPTLLELELDATIVASLKLVDLALTGNLILMVILAGYENFVSRFRLPTLDQRPAWMGHTDFATLKIKLITSIVAISSIQVLEAFMDIAHTDKGDLAWLVGTLLAFVVSGAALDHGSDRGPDRAPRPRSNRHSGFPRA
ncbi:MAG: TIGR00645 family protein [Pseudomonadota bacterium]